MKTFARATAATALAMLALAPAAGAVVQEDDRVARSQLDGTPIVYKLFLPDDASAASPVPAVLMTHGWGGSRARSYGGFVQQLVEAGYAVLTWDQRGFGQSGGEANVDDPDVEARDAMTLVDVLAADPRIAQEAPGDPRVGMAGGSYAGGIQYVTAARDERIDAIAPEIAWNNLLSSLMPNGVLKMGWDLLLYFGGQTSITGGLGTSNPTGRPETGGYHPMIHRALAEGVAVGEWSPEVREWFARKGPRHLLDSIDAPTFIVQATTDSLFTLTEAIANHRALSRAGGPPLKMAWYCGGHGSCAPFANDSTNRVRDRIVAWFDRWVREDDGVETGPGFEYLTQDGAWHAAETYPVAGTGPLRGSGSGVVAVNGEPVQTGITTGSSARTTLKVPIEPGTGVAIGQPVVRMRALAAGAAPDSPLRVPLFLQVVDTSTGNVLGNQVTPVVVTADGSVQEQEVAIQAVSYRLAPGTRLALEVASTAAGYEPYRGAAVVDLQRIEVELPVLP